MDDEIDAMDVDEAQPSIGKERGEGSAASFFGKTPCVFKSH